MNERLDKRTCERTNESGIVAFLELYISVDNIYFLAQLFHRKKLLDNPEMT